MKDNYYILSDYHDKLNGSLKGLFKLTDVLGKVAEIRQGDKIYYVPFKKIKRHQLQ